MSHVTTSDHAAVLVRAADAERIGFPPQTVRLLADSPSTGGKLSAQRVSGRADRRRHRGCADALCRSSVSRDHAPDRSADARDGGVLELARARAGCDVECGPGLHRFCAPHWRVKLGHGDHLQLLVTVPGLEGLGISQRVSNPVPGASHVPMTGHTGRYELAR